MDGVRGGRERGSVFRRRRVRSVVFAKFIFGFYECDAVGSSPPRLASKKLLDRVRRKNLSHWPHRLIFRHFSKPARRT